jgi:hypothetical protein
MSELGYFADTEDESDMYLITEKQEQYKAGQFYPIRIGGILGMVLVLKPGVLE